MPFLVEKLLGDTAGDYARKIAAALGLRVNAASAEIITQLQSDPATIIRLRKLDIEEQRLYIGDVQSARAGDVAKTQATGKRDIFMYSLAGLIVAGFFMLIGVLMFVAVPDQQNQLLSIMFGALTVLTGQVGNYFFGSSAGSARKTEIQTRAPNGKP